MALVNYRAQWTYKNPNVYGTRLNLVLSHKGEAHQISLEQTRIGMLFAQRRVIGRANCSAILPRPKGPGAFMHEDDPTCSSFLATALHQKLIENGWMLLGCKMDAKARSHLDSSFIVEGPRTAPDWSLVDALAPSAMFANPRSYLHPACSH